MKARKMLMGLIITLLLVNFNFVFAQDPIADYSFDVDASDATGNFNGTLEGDAAIVDDADRGKVLSLTETGFVSVPPEVANGVDDFTVAAWVNFGGTNPWAGLFGIGQSALNAWPYWDMHLKSDYTIRFYSSEIAKWPSDGCAQLVINYELPPLEWVHIALSFTKNSGAAVYINSVAQELQDWTGDNDYSVSPGDVGAEVFFIGKDAFNQQTLTGTFIDDFKFYNTALTQEEVVAIYTGATSVEEKVILASNYQLAQNYPNPFNPETTIKFNIPERSKVKLSIFNIEGQEIAVLVNDFRNAGTYSESFNGSNLTSGVYFYRLESNGHSTTKQMLLLK